MSEELRQSFERATKRKFTKAEKRSILHVNEFLAQLDDHILVEVTIATVCNCAFRLAVDRESDTAMHPTSEVFKQALNDTLVLIGDSLKNEHGN